MLSTGITRNVLAPTPVDEDFRVMDLRTGTNRFKSLHHKSDKERVGEEVVQHIQDCLDVHEFGLTDIAKDKVARMVTEVIENAETHSGKPQWWVSAYQLFDHDNSQGHCHIAIVGFGKTIAESLQELDPQQPVRQRIEELVNRHSAGGLFGPTWTEESLWTVYALQESVSRLRNEKEGKNLSRGIGLTDLIEFFLWFGSTSPTHGPRMSIISGRTRIIITKDDVMSSSAGGLRALTLNRSLSLEDRPSQKSVTSTRVSFPGTVISFEFTLERGHLENIEREE